MPARLPVSSHTPSNGPASFALPVIVVGSFAALAAQPDLRLAVPLVVGVALLVSAALAAVLYLGERGQVGWSAPVILFVALAVRLLFVLAPPQLSDDVYRYVWDGRQVLRGADPYQFAPADAVVPAAQEELRQRVNHPELVTIYPPGAQVLFAAASLGPGGATGMKLFFVLLDLGTCALLIGLLDRLGWPRWRAVLYAWHPLPVLEIAGSGHLDGAGLLFLLLTCLILCGRGSRRLFPSPGPLSYILAGIAAGWAGWIKLVPFFFLPGLLLFAPRGRRAPFLGGVAAASAGLMLLFPRHLENLAETLGVYAAHWEFGGLAFALLRRLTQAGAQARGVLAGAFIAAVVILAWRLHRELAALPDRDRTGGAAMERVLVFCARVALAFLLLTPTLHPWYALTLAVFLPFAAGPASLVLCGAVFLSYRVLIAYALLCAWVEHPAVTAAVCLAPVVAAVLSRWARHLGRRWTPAPP